jgi:hypothetical protein
MRRIAPFVLLVLAVLFLGLPAFLSFALPAWGPRGCSPVGGFAMGQVRQPMMQPVHVQPVLYEWRANVRNPDQLDLYRNGHQVGAWFQSEGKFYSSNGPTWREASPPIAAPSEGRGELVQNFGLDLDHLEKKQGVYLHTKDGARQVSYEAAADVIQNGLVDDRHKLQLTFISGDKSKRETFLKEATSLGDLVMRAVPPDYVGLQDSETGKPLFQVSGDTVYLQQPDGKVLARMADVKPGDLAQLAKVVEGIRKPKPYEPDKDPDPRKPKVPDPSKPDASPLTPILQSVPPAAWVLLGLVLLGGVATVARNTAPR